MSSNEEDLVSCVLVAFSVQAINLGLKTTPSLFAPVDQTKRVLEWIEIVALVEFGRRLMKD